MTWPHDRRYNSSNPMVTKALPLHLSLHNSSKPFIHDLMVQIKTFISYPLLFRLLHHLFSSPNLSISLHPYCLIVCGQYESLSKLISQSLNLYPSPSSVSLFRFLDLPSQSPFVVISRFSSSMSSTFLLYLKTFAFFFLFCRFRIFSLSLPSFPSSLFSLYLLIPSPPPKFVFSLSSISSPPPKFVFCLSISLALSISPKISLSLSRSIVLSHILFFSSLALPISLSTPFFRLILVHGQSSSSFLSFIFSLNFSLTSRALSLSLSQNFVFLCLNFQF